jgi:hypothetical protein
LAPTTFVCNRTLIEAVPENSTAFDVFFAIETTVLGVSPESFEIEIVQDIYKNASAEALGAFVDNSDVDIKCVSEYRGEVQTQGPRRLQTSTFFGAVILSTVNFDVSSTDVDAKTAAEVSQASLLESIESGSFQDLLLSLAISNGVQFLQNASTNADLLTFQTVLPAVTSGFEAKNTSSAFAYRAGMSVSVSVVALLLIFFVDRMYKIRRTRGSLKPKVSKIAVEPTNMSDEGITNSSKPEVLWSIENNTTRDGSPMPPNMTRMGVEKGFAGGSSDGKSDPTSGEGTSCSDSKSGQGFKQSGMASSPGEPDAHLQENTSSISGCERQSDTWKWTTAAREQVEALRKEGCTAQEAYMIVFQNRGESEEKESLDNVAFRISNPRLPPISPRRWSQSSSQNQPKSPTQSSMKGNMPYVQEFMDTYVLSPPRSASRNEDKQTVSPSTVKRFSVEILGV